MPNLTELTCAQCGRTFERLAYEVRRRSAKHHFCSRQCNYAAATWHNPRHYQKPITRQMPLEERAWFAGLFDGEGWISFCQENQKRKRAERIKIGIGITNEEILLRVQRITWVGRIYLHPKQAAHHKDKWVWEAYGPNAVDLITQMSPWLIIKRGRAAKAMSLYEAP